MQRLRPQLPAPLPRPLPTRAAIALILSGAVLALTGCSTGKHWVGEPDHAVGSTKPSTRIVDDRQLAQQRRDAAAQEHETMAIGDTQKRLEEDDLTDAPGDRPVLKLQGTKKDFKGPVDGKLVGVFRNTYYDFPSESDFEGAATPLMNAQCKVIRKVPRGFHDAVCVQGSGTLATGATVSFAKRDCKCALTCERTGQKICFDKLDRKKFPWGRGALGKPITPLRSVAVDSDVIPLGTPIYIAEFDGVARKPGGALHDGCFIAEDRGMKVQGEHVDVFTGNASVTKHLNGVLPSNRGVHVYVGTARCQ